MGSWEAFAQKVADEIHRMLLNSAKEPVIQFSDYICDKLKEVTSRHQLSAVGKIIARYRDEMLFASPPKEAAQKFLDAQDEYFKNLAETEKEDSETEEDEDEGGFDIVKYANDIINGKVPDYVPGGEVSDDE